MLTFWDMGRPLGDCWVGTACPRAGLGGDRLPAQGLDVLALRQAFTPSERVTMAQAIAEEIGKREGVISK